ncbi:uncharacterized PE-PGRS family protein PE_PGRS54-like [Rana temporaria]|uniref:uncharacterized PE-PGRS family protein PE_PGRS54-like n=1 Tax=Rana temporaria TaxID=8407 RepID=UPI001AAC6AA4|nr:uncharacterized PE-PGRS family protein PE_PGRS54-like [Rana temporaria]
MGVLPILVLSALCLLNAASTEDKANCLYNGNVISHGETVTDGCKICECDNGEIKDCVVKAGCISKNLETHDGVSTNFEDDPNVIESSVGKQLKRKTRSIKQANLNMGKSGSKGGANVDGKVAVTSGIARIKGFGIGGNNKGANAEVKVDVTSGGADGKSFGIGGGADLSSIFGSGKSNNKGANAEVKVDVKSGGADGKSFGIGGGADLSSIFGSGKSQLGGINSGAALNGAQENKVIGVQVGAAVNGGQDNKDLFGLKGGNIQLGGANLQTGGLLGQQKGNIELGNSGKIQTLEIKGKHEIKGESEKSSEENKEDGKYHIDLKGDTQLGDVNITLGDLLGHLNGKTEISTDDLTKLFQLNETEIKGGLGKTFNVDGGKYQIGLKSGKSQLGDTNLQLGGLSGNQNGKINFGNGGETRTFEIKGQHEFKGGLGISSEEDEEGKKNHIDLKGDTQLGDVNITLGDLLGHLNGKTEISTDDLTKLFQLNETEIKGGLGKTFNVDGGKYQIGLKSGKSQLGDTNLQLGGLSGNQNGKINFGNGGETRTFEIKGQHGFKGGLGISSEEDEEGKKNLFSLKGGNIQLGGANLQTGGLLGQQKGNIDLGNSGKIQKLEIKGTHEIKGGSEKSSEENKEDGKYHIDLKGDTQLGDVNITLGDLLGHLNGKTEISTDDLTKLFQLNETEIKGGLGKTFNVDGGKYRTDLKSGKFQLGDANLQLGGLFGKNGQNNFDNGGETRTFEIKGQHEMKGGFGKNSEENEKANGGDRTDLKSGKFQLGDANLQLGGLFGKNGKINFDNGGETRTFEIKGQHEMKGGFGKNSEETEKANGGDRTDLKSGKFQLGDANLQLGGLFGKNGKINFDNGGETRTFEIKGQHEMKGGFGKNSEETEKANGGDRTDLKSGKFQLGDANLQLGGLFGKNGKINFDNGGETRTFEIKGQHEMKGGFGKNSEETEKANGGDRTDLKSGKFQLGDANLQLGGLFGKNGKINFDNGGETRTFEIKGQHEMKGGFGKNSEETEKANGGDRTDLKSGKFQLGDANLQLGGLFGKNGKINFDNGGETRTFEIKGQHEMKGGFGKNSEETEKANGGDRTDLKSGKFQLGDANLQLGGLFGKNGKINFDNGGETRTFEIKGQHEMKGGFGKNSEETEKANGGDRTDLKSGKFQLGDANLQLGGLFGKNGKINFDNGGETRTFEIKGQHEMKGGFGKNSEETEKANGGDRTDLKSGKFQLGDANLQLGGLFGKNGKINFDNGGETRTFEIKGQHEMKGGFGKNSEETEKANGGDRTDLKSGKFQLGDANLQLGGLFGKNGKINFDNGGETRTFEIKGQHEMKGGFGKNSEETEKANGGDRTDLKSGKFQLGDANLQLGGLFGKNGKINFDNGGETRTFEIKGQHEMKGGFGKNSEETEKANGGDRTDLKSGKFQLGDANLQLGGLFGKNGKINVDNGGETRTFEIKGQHEMKGGFGKNSEETEKANGGGQLNLGFGRGNQEKQGEGGINIQGGNKDSSEEDKGKLNLGFGHGSQKKQGKVGINIQGGSKDSSEEDKGPINVSGGFSHGQSSNEKRGKVDNSKRSSQEDKGKLNLGFGHGSQKKQGKLGINIQGGSNDSSEEDKGKLNLGFGHGSQKKQGKAGINIQGGSKDSSEEDKGRINVSGGFSHGQSSHEEVDNSKRSSHEDKGKLNLGFGHGSQKKQGKVGINIQGGSKDSSEEDKGPINVSGGFSHGQSSNEKRGKVDNSKGSSQEDKGKLNLGFGHGSQKKQGKLGINIQGGSNDSSEEDKGKLNLGFGHGSQKKQGKAGINIQGGSKDSSEEDKGRINVSGGFSHGQSSHEEVDNSKRSSHEDKGKLNLGFGHGSQKKQGKVGINIQGGSKDSSEEDKGRINVSGGFSHGQSSHEEHRKVKNNKGSSHEGKENGSDSHENNGKHEGKHKGRHDSSEKKKNGSDSHENNGKHEGKNKGRNDSSDKKKKWQ